MGRKKVKNKEINIKHGIRRIIIVAVILIAIITIIKYAPNYVKDDLADATKLIINNNDATRSLKSDLIIDGTTIYASIDDIRNFFDETITVEDNKIITTSNTKTVALYIDNTQILVNSSKSNLEHKIFSKDGKYYLPITDMGEIYNYDLKYNENSKIITIDSLNRKAVQAVVSNNTDMKYKPTTWSKNIENLQRGETIYLVQDNETSTTIERNGWTRVRATNGKLGYIKSSDIINEKTIREKLEQTKSDEKISIAWDYYTSDVKTPTRTEKIDGINVISPSFYALKSDGTISANFDKKYIKWAKENRYQIWPTLTNSEVNNLDIVSQILSKYETRAKLIDSIIDKMISEEVNGINVDFENMYKSDKDNYSRFIIELAPRLKEIGMKLSVVVTAPDGADNWSLCYDRHTISKSADYIVFLGLDQHTISSTTAGTVSGANWIELNIKKLLGQEEIDKDKIIVEMPLYTRLWKEENGKLSSEIVNLKDVQIPDGVEKQWNDKLKQYYIEYSQDGITYKMWIEDEESIKAKIDLVNTYTIAGAGFWDINRGNSDIWNIIKEKLDI